jgi:hypothetical protein
MSLAMLPGLWFEPLDNLGYAGASIPPAPNKWRGWSWGIQEVALGPDGELLGVVVHSGLVLGRSKDVVAAVRRITAFPGGLALDTVVLARGIHAEAAGRREHAATAQRRAAETAQREDEAAAQHDSEAAPSGKAPQRPNGITRGWRL